MTQHNPTATAGESLSRHSYKYPLNNQQEEITIRIILIMAVSLCMMASSFAGIITADALGEFLYLHYQTVDKKLKRYQLCPLIPGNHAVPRKLDKVIYKNNKYRNIRITTGEYSGCSGWTLGKNYQENSNN